MRLRQFLTCCMATILITTSQAYAWGPDGHKTVAAIAYKLIEGTHAAKEVKDILGDLCLKEASADLCLQDASVWADCAKGVGFDHRSRHYTYQSAGRYPECAVYENHDGEKAMIDFVARNDKNCNPDGDPGEESCHKQYHYTDVSIDHDRYDRAFIRTSDYDIIHAVVAAAKVLKGDPAPAPFNIKDKHEALLLLAHYVGDIHQPLHVGAVYLDEKGKIYPDKGTYNPRTDTHGGNNVRFESMCKSLHILWDDIPASLTVAHLNYLLEEAKAIPVTDGKVYDWPASWASDTIGAAKKAFEGLEFGNRQEEDRHGTGQWFITKLPVNYICEMDRIKKEQLVKAGARLAQLLKAIWP